MNHSLNRRALERLLQIEPIAEQLRVASHASGRVFDFGVKTRGGLAAGLELARICLGDAGHVNLIQNHDQRTTTSPSIQVFTDQPALACMGAQYGGWQVQTDEYFAIGSGPIRLRRGKEPVLEQYKFCSQETLVVGVLEADQLPGDSVIEYMAEQCRLDPGQIRLCVAPTRSLAGTIQVVARSVEATMHKLYELHHDLNTVTSAFGSAPLPPVSRDDMTAIGRTNDAILYGGCVTLWVDLTDEQIGEIGPRAPAESSPEHGRPFAEIFEASGGDFYQLDPLLFSAAQITFISNFTGRQHSYGSTDPEILKRSFGEP